MRAVWWVRVICFFFFQAADGIRVRLVTGVQTCASSDLWVYTVLSQVIYGDIERNVEAVINMTQTGKDTPFLLYWRLQ